MKRCLMLIMNLRGRFQSIILIWHMIWLKLNGEALPLKSPQSQRLAWPFLRVTSRHYEPFIYEEGGKFKGIEYELIKIIAEKEHLNFSIEFGDKFEDQRHFMYEFQMF